MWDDSFPFSVFGGCCIKWYQMMQVNNNKVKTKRQQVPQSIICREKRVWEMASFHSADVGKRCPQPWVCLQDWSIIPLSQSLQGVLNGGTEPQRPDSHPAMLPAILGFTHWFWELRISMSLCCHTSGLAGQGQFAVFSLPGAWWFATLPGRSVSQYTPWVPTGCRIPLVPCWPMVPVSSCLHSTMSSCCSTLNFHFSFTKIKTQAHNQAQNSPNLRWKALLRTEARRAAFQRLIAFSECISIYFFFSQHWNPWVLGSLRKEGALKQKDKEPRERTKKEQKLKMFLSFCSKAQFSFYLFPCVMENKNCKY